jgi:hypothetical protein
MLTPPRFQTRRASLRLALLCFAVVSLALPPLHATAIPGPAGIFAIGDTHYVPGDVAKFDLDFVDGYTLRVPWTDLETWDSAVQASVYNFSRIDSTLEDLRARGKRMTLEIFIVNAPAHVLAQPGTVTWLNPHPTQGGTQVVPWDANALAAYRAFLLQLSNHIVAGTTWRIADHPTLESVDAPIIGLQGLRELSGTLVQQPSYTRDGFVQAVVDSVTASREAFPAKFGFLALFAMEDGVASPSLDDTILARLLAGFNQAGRPTLGFFQETLSDTGPNPASLGALLAQASTQTYILFQALRPWTLKDGDPRPPEIASGTPLAGLERAWNFYNASYVELYGGDILNTANQDGLRRWSHFLHEVGNVRNQRDIPRLENPAPSEFRLRWTYDALLSQRLWQSTDLATWSLLDPGEALDGDLLLPANPAARVFYRLETLVPVR